MDKRKTWIALSMVGLLSGCVNGGESMSSSSETKLTGISAIYNGDNSIAYGAAVESDLFDIALQYGEDVQKGKKEDFVAEIISGSTFSKDKVQVKVTSTQDESISTTLELLPKERESMKILFVGNSFSDDTIEWMYDIAKELNVDLHAENLYISGCDIVTHYHNALSDAKAYTWVRRSGSYWSRLEGVSFKDRVEALDWDYISFQQASAFSGIEDSYYYLAPLLEKAEGMLSNKEHTQFVFNMTWAYQGDSTHGDFYRYQNNQMLMYQMITNAVTKKVLPISKIKALIPNGTAIQNARSSFIGDNLTRDGYHLSYDLGRYIAGLTAMKTLTGKNIDNLLFSPVDETRTLIAKESVDNALINTLIPTNSIYNQNPYSLEELEANYDVMPLPFYPGYFDSTNSTPSTRITKSDLSKRFASCDIMPTEAFPDGSIIYIKRGYKYRPEAWHNLNAKTGLRPEITNNDFTKIDENWKKDYAYRAFNISRGDDGIISDEELEAINNGDIFKIFVPRN